MKSKSMSCFASLTLGLVLGGCRTTGLDNQSEEAQATNVPATHPVSYTGLDQEGGSCTFRTELSEDGKELKIFAKTTELEANFSVSVSKLPLPRGFKEEKRESVPASVEEKSYDGKWFKWENRETTGFFSSQWFKMKSDASLLKPSSFELKISFGPVPVPSKTRNCTFR